MINKLKRTVALVLSFLMLISIIPISAVKGNTQANEVQVFKIDPAAFDWEGNDASWIDFSKISEEIPVNGTLKGNGLDLITTESTGTTRASNKAENGYMLLGKGARVNDNPEDMATKPTVTGAIYVKLDKALAEKQETPYIVKVDYYGGNVAEDDAVNGGSYIDLRFNSLTSANSVTRKVYNNTWKADADQSAYFELPKADFSENIGNSHADFRLETWTGARLRIKRISVIPYTPENIPEMTTVDAVKEPVVADFSTISTTASTIPKNKVLTENIVGDGLSIIVTQSTGGTRGANQIKDGYLIFGKEARKNDNPADMAEKEYVNGAVYIKINKALAEKQNKPYAVKIDYFGGGELTINGGSYIDLRYNDSTDNNNKSERNTLGATCNSGKDESMYYLLPNADFSESIKDSTCGADFRLETWCNGAGARLKIKGVSVVEYDPNTVTEASALFENNSAVMSVSLDSSSSFVPTGGNSITDGVLTENVVSADGGLTLVTTESTGSNRGANQIKGGYLIFGKEARKNDNPADKEKSPYVNGAVYIKINKALAEKQNKPYAVKVDYYGGGELKIDSGSYVDLRYNDSTDNNNKSARNTLGATCNSGKDESMYYLLPNADFSESINGSSCGADFRLETWCGSPGARLKIKSVSVVEYDPNTVTEASALFENNTAVKTIEFNKIPAPAVDRYSDEILKGKLEFDGATVLTNIEDGNSRAANRLTSDGYMLLGKDARKNTLSTGNVTNQGRIYFKLNESNEDKKDKRYAVKVEYLAKKEAQTLADSVLGIASSANTYNDGTYLELHYSTDSTNDAKTAQFKFGDTFNSGNVEAAYFLLPDAVFKGGVADGNQNKGADFRIDTYNSGTQLKIKSISVVEYDTEKTPADASQEKIAQLFSGKANSVFMNITTGKSYGIKYPEGTSVYRVVDNNGTHYAAQSVEYLSFTVTDETVKAAKELTLTIKYWDIGKRSFSVQYNAFKPDGWEELNPESFYNYYSTPAFEMQNSKELRTISIPLDNAAFAGKQNGGTDFRLNTQYIPDFYVEEISLEIGVEDVTLRQPVPFPETTELNNFKDRTIVGYQAWFQASEDKTQGWNHWNSGSAPAGGKQTFDVYPDVTGYPEDVLFQTDYADLLNGNPAVLYDGTTEGAIDTQVKWMQEYGIDGFAVSRFFAGTSAVKTPGRTKLDYMVEAAEKYDRLFYMGYDMSGIGGHGEAGIKRLMSDFVLNVEEKFVSSPNYAQIDGKPVVSLWGFQGSQFNRYPNTENALKLINWFKDRGYYVIGGCPDNDWANDKSDYAAVYEAIDMITPWTVGRYNHNNAQAYLDGKYKQDKAWIDDFNEKNPNNQKSYMPTIFPGFSWANWASGEPNSVSRLAGEFMWDQATLAKKYGFSSSFIAMFDEYDEGTSILKMAEDSMSIPKDQYFVTAAADGKWLSSDFYMRATAAITKMLRGELEATDSIPIPHSLGPVFWRNGFERRYLNYKASNGQMTTTLANIDVCIPDGKLIENEGIDDVYYMDMYEDPYGEGFTTTGEYSYNLNGVAKPESGKNGKFYFQIAETDIAIQKGMKLSYKLRNETDLGGYVFVDLMLDNGKKLSDVCKTVKIKRGTQGTWTPVNVEIPAELAGQKIVSVIIAYESEHTGEFNAYVDDIIIDFTDTTKDGLKNLVKEAKSIINGESAKSYTGNSVDALSAVIKKAEAVLNDSNATENSIKAMYYELMSAINNLVSIVKTTAPSKDPINLDNKIEDLIDNKNENAVIENEESVGGNINEQTPDTQKKTTIKEIIEESSSLLLWIIVIIIAATVVLLLMMMIYYKKRKLQA